MARPAQDRPIVIPKELPAQRHYLVIVNPKSGPGKSLEIFLNRVRPILAEADISHLLLVTERQNHAKEFIKHLNLSQWSGILVISGDGLLFEVYNGLMERQDWKKAVKIPIGIIPGGSGNGLARSISHACGEPYIADPILASTLGIVKGRIAPLDLMKIETPRHSPLYSFLTVGWGLMSDIDIESERLRAIGEIRFTLWAFWRVASLRIYNGRISYLPVTQRKEASTPEHHSFTQSDTTAKGCMTNGMLETNGLRRKSASAPEASSWSSTTELDEATAVDLEVVTDNHVCRAAKEPSPPEVADNTDSFPSLTDPVPSDWTVEEGKFVMIYSSLQSHLGTHLFFAPEARPDDGILWLLIIDANVTRFQLLNYFKQQEDGNHLSLPYVRMVPVRAFRLESYTDCFMTVDGELIRTPVLQARVLSALGRVLTF
ncbi:sphingosine kinase 2-like isoform X2 [Ornithodoros turicata]|uniref:sphingosine kinase 2-like isoform X2 n=1 Tax=Ornithodoros turicata TaxID=34597 RepID=UPI0031392811